MCKRMIFVILLLGMAGSAFAADCDWNNYSGDRQWDNPVNWDPELPTSADKAGIRHGALGPIIDTGTTAVAYQCMVGDWGSTDVLGMTGGSLTVGAIMVLGYGVNDDGTLNISGGTITQSGGEGLHVGRDGVGTINMTGGTINATTFAIAYLTGTGDVQLDGGTISCGSFSMNSSASMDLTDTGVLIVNGDATSTINGYISSGWLTAYGGSGTLAVDYDVSNPGKTTVTGQSPEKASYPSPGNGATGVSINTDLSWTAGIYAVSNDVYFGTDPTPDETEFKGNQTETTYELPQLDLGTDYYWRIDGVDTGDPCSPWVGDVWNFTTQASTATLRKGPYMIYPGNNTEMQVLWQLDYNDVCSIEWGLDTNYSDGNENVSEYGSDHQYKHTISGLTPGALYYYKVNVGTGATTGSFRAAPSDSATSVKFLMGGDRQSLENLIMFQNASNAVNATMTSDPAYQSVLLFAGDLVTDGDTEEQWDDQWFNRTLPEPMEMMSKLPIQPCQGNHESSGVGFGKYYPCPWVSGKWWSFDYGPVHVAVIDVDNAPFATGSAQHNWLTNDLSTTNKDFKIVMYHQPAWSAGTHQNEPDIQAYIQPLCVQYGVNICLNGHNHNYVHALVEGVHHVTSGGFGASLYNVKPDNPYVITAIETQNFQTVEIVGNTMTVTSLNTSLEVIDTFQVIATVCGDDTCEGAENQCNCPDDCGTPPSTETSCTDDFDNDCDTYTDCDDSDCDSDPACMCGDGICSLGEDCHTCPDDCISRTSPPKLAYCCGDGTCEGAENETNCAVDCGGGSFCGDETCDPGEDQCNCPEDCGTPPSTETSCTDEVDNDCDTYTDCDDADCDGDPACPTCGDETCDPGEDQCNCPADCGTPPSTETGYCDDGINNDCDADTDCDDSDCEGDPACPDCLAKGEPCTTNEECCSNDCHPVKGTCK